MADEQTAIPAQTEINVTPPTKMGESIFAAIKGAPIKRSEMSPNVDLDKVKKEFGEEAFEKDPEPVVDKKKEEDNFDKEVKKDDEPEKKVEPAKEVSSSEKAKDEPQKDLKSKDEPQIDEDETEAKGKIKNINDARKFYKESKKEKKELGAKLSTAETKLKEAEDKLAKLESAPKPDDAKIAEQEKLVAELQAREQHVKEQLDYIEQRTAAYNVQDSEPYKRLVAKPLERMGTDLEELASSVSDEQADQVAFMQSVGRALGIEDPKLRRKALEEVGAPLSSMQQAELIELAKEHKRVMSDKQKLTENGKQAMQIIKEKEDIDRKERIAKNAKELQDGAREAREELKKTYSFFSRTDLPDSYKTEIKELEDAIDKIDPSRLPAKEVGKMIEGYYRMKMLNRAASEHIKSSEETHKTRATELEAAKKEIEDLKKLVANGKSKEKAIDSTRPNLEDGNTNNTDENPGFATSRDMVHSLLFKSLDKSS